MRRSACIVGVLVLVLAFPARVLAVVSIAGLIVGSETPTTSSASLSFSGSPPFTIYRSMDGNDWGEPLTTGLMTGGFTDHGLNNYFNYYYKVQDSEGLEKIAAAYPPTNNIHSSLAQFTAFCAACHVTHASTGSKLLSQPNSVALCTTCHDGTQSKYDVRNGLVRLSDGYANTSGGPFGPLQPELSGEIAVSEANKSYSAENVPTNPTSIHNLGTVISTAPGGVSTRDAGLVCVDCHDPHGITGNYRNLKSTLKVNDAVTVDINLQAYAKTDPAQTGGYGEDIYYNTGSVFFCSACHSDFNQPSGSGNIAATDTEMPGLALSAAYTNKYMHPVNTPLIFRGEYYASSLPLESGTGENVVVCLTCHHAHGTFKTGRSIKTNSTALIRLDRQAVCEECHKK